MPNRSDYQPLSQDVDEAREQEEEESDEDDQIGGSSSSAAHNEQDSEEEEEKEAASEGEEVGDAKASGADSELDTRIFTVDELEGIFLQYAPKDTGI